MKRINLLGEKDNPQRARRLKRIVKKLIPAILVVAIFISLAIFIATLSSGSSVFNYIFTGSSLNSSDGRVNVLLLGTPGSNFAGSSLTDTIIVASYNLKTNNVHLISIPRDLWLPSLQAKANAVYEIGLRDDNGLNLAKIVFGNVVGLSIHYGLRADFRGFIQAIDILGGIDVLVENSFDDYTYPITGKENDMCGWEEKEIEFSEDQAKQLNIEPGKRKVIVMDSKIATDSAQENKGIKYFSCRFEHISFEKGLIHMDGKEALQFVRSRHGTKGEGSDFARSKRQQKVLEAVRKKVLSFETFGNPQKISELLETFGRSIDTDISVKDALEFYRFSGKLEGIKSIVLDDSKKEGLPEGRRSLLVHPNPSDFGGAYVLISQDDDFSIVQKFVKKVLSGEIEEDEATTSARSRDI